MPGIQTIGGGGDDVCLMAYDTDVNLDTLKRLWSRCVKS